jgi:hypothetical protein
LSFDKGDLVFGSLTLDGSDIPLDIAELSEFLECSLYPVGASNLQSQIANIHSERDRSRSIRQPPSTNRMR